MVFTEFERCDCGIGYLMRNSEPNYLQCTYCNKRKLITGSQLSLQFPDSG